MNTRHLARRALRSLVLVTLGSLLVGGTSTAAHAAVEPDRTLLPFAATSPWRLGIAAGATFAPASDPRNAQMAAVDAPGAVWLNSGQYSHPVAYARTSDPLATMVGPAWQGRWQEHIPATARIAGGYDRHMHVVTPDRQNVQEHYKVARLSTTSYTSGRRHEVSLAGAGTGPQNGTRAYGGSAIGGLIRAWEVDPAHPSYTGEIRHPLAVALPLSKLKYTGRLALPNNPLYDDAGYGTLQGYVWPATEQDNSSATYYKGAIPMGSYFAIPPEVDIAALGITSPQARMIAKAAQDYGVYVTDASGASVFYLEDAASTATKTFATGATGPKGSGDDLRRIFRSLKAVTSNSQFTPNGGALGVARRGAPAVPALPAPTPFSAKVRFADAASTPPAGYAADWGQAFGARTGPTQGSLLSYGWVRQGTTTAVDLVKNGRVRTGTSTTDPRLTGVMHMDWQSTAGPTGRAVRSSWELAVPNGTYTVGVSVGDAANSYDSVHQISVEGVPAVTGFVGSAQRRFAAATVTAEVTDGRLTVSQAGGTNTKLNYVDVATAGAGTGPILDAVVEEPTGTAAHVRFADAASVPPVGFAADWGQPFGPRTGSAQGSGLTYGWVSAGTTTPLDLSRNGRVRTGTATTDRRLLGVMHMDWQSAAGSGGTAVPGSWELAVANGTYTVTLSVGDAGNYYDSTHGVSVEGVPAVQGFVGSSARRFAEATVTVPVTDGRLTLSPSGGRNTKLNYVSVVPVATSQQP